MQVQTRFDPARGATDTGGRVRRGDDAGEAAGAEPDGLAQIGHRLVNLIRPGAPAEVDSSMHCLVHDL